MTIASSLNKAVKRILNASVKAVNNASKEKLTLIRKLSPTDTRSYINAHKVKPARLVGTTVTGGNFNKGTRTDPSKVEDGWRKTKVGWHKGPPRTVGTRMRRGVGAKVYTIAAKDKKIVEDALKKGLKNI